MRAPNGGKVPRILFAHVKLARRLARVLRLIQKKRLSQLKRENVQRILARHIQGIPEDVSDLIGKFLAKRQGRQEEPTLLSMLGHFSEQEETWLSIKTPSSRASRHKRGVVSHFYVSPSKAIGSRHSRL